MPVQNLLDRVATALQTLNCAEVAKGCGVGYDTVVRMRNRSHHDPGYTSVHTVAEYLHRRGLLRLRRARSPSKPTPVEDNLVRG